MHDRSIHTHTYTHVSIPFVVAGTFTHTRVILCEFSYSTFLYYTLNHYFDGFTLVGLDADAARRVNALLKRRTADVFNVRSR